MMTVLRTIAALALSDFPVTSNHLLTSPFRSVTKSAASRLVKRTRFVTLAWASVVAGAGAVAVIPQFMSTFPAPPSLMKNPDSRPLENGANAVVEGATSLRKVEHQRVTT